jgi:hypothetical protein
MRLVVMYRNVSNDVSLTYHKFKNQLRCHYCGYPLLNLPIVIAVLVSILTTKDLVRNKYKELVIFPTKYQENGSRHAENLVLKNN